MTDITNMVGFETGGDEEAEDVIGGASVATDQVKNGSYSLKASVAGDGFRLRSIDGDTLAIQDNRIAAIKVRFSSVSSGIFLVNEDVNGVDNFSIGLSNSAKLEVFDRSGVSVAVGSLTFVVDTWYSLEIFWETRNTNAPMEIDVDGVNDISIAGEDFDGGISDWAMILQAPTSNDIWFDDYYRLADVAGSSDFLGPNTYISKSYQNTAEDDADQGDALDRGRWNDMADLPGVDEKKLAGYTANAALSGYTRYDEGSRAGPLTDIIDNVIAAKWVWRVRRTGGSPTEHYLRYGAFGGSVDQLSERDVTYLLGNSLQNISVIRDGLGETNLVPEANDEYFVQGFRKSSGKRDILCAEMWAMILQNPS